MRTRHLHLPAFLALALSAHLTAAQEILPLPPPSMMEAGQDVGRYYLPAPPLPPTFVPSRDSDAAPPEAAAQYPLEVLLDSALLNNPTLRQARAHITAEMAKALEAGLYPNPLARYSGDIIGGKNSAGQRTAGEFQGGIAQQQFVTAGKLALSRQKYIARARVSEHLAVAQQYRVLNDVRMHYYRALASAEVLRIERELLKVAEDRSLTSRESYNQGQARRPKVRQADIMLQRARLSVNSSSNEVDQRFRELMSLVGTGESRGGVVGELKTDEPYLKFESALDRLLQESPELSAARAKLNADRITVQREQVQWVPNVTITGGSGYNYIEPGSVASASATIEVPLFDRNQGTVRQAQADLARQQSEIQRVELELRRKFAEVYQRYATAWQSAAQYEQVILPEAQAAYREYLEEYKARRTEWPDVLDAQHDLFHAQQEYVRHLETLRIHETLITGFLLQDGLAPAMGPVPAGHIDSVPKPR